MGANARKASRKALKKASAHFPNSDSKPASADFLPLEGDQLLELPETKPQQNKATVLYIGRIPHGFYEKEMEAYFKQFGAIKRLRIARNKKTGKSKHFGFIEFENPQVAEVVADWDYVQIERQRHNKVRTLEEHKKLVEKILKQVVRRRKRIEAAGIDYECPEIVGSVQPAPKKIKFDED
ncbi:putative lysyl-tRNA synthetase [Hibiscus syriacus]|uniref:Lysyl-tRNA synthetase n=1 Tax=Hibiscus syriacus TaxID=106335 RepID=A0A6A3AUD3_HIBSY|nr:putative lysyl-tRNA synthetase [Hibiscus syriacus]